MSYQSMNEAKERCEREEIPFWKAIQLEDAEERGIEVEDSWNKMKYMWQSMLDALDAYEPDLISRSGLVGKEGGLMEAYREKGNTLCGDFMAKVMTNALKMGCNNACMKRIVAAPTAGSCGVIPAVLISMEEKDGYSQQKMIEALFVSAGIGEVISERASISGAQGGCQAEIGAASAMAAAAVTYLKGGSSRQIADAAALALKSLLGLVCDPVAGLVEVPCVKRNVIGAVNAITSSDMVIAGIESRIPADEVIDAMGEVGSLLPCSLKETSQAGLATTPTGLKVTERMAGNGFD